MINRKLALLPLSKLIVRLMPIVTLIISSFVLTSCAYSGSFTCPDAKGAKCMMLSRVDEQVSSGEIEKYYEDRKCLFGKCKTGANKQDERPALSGGDIIKAKILEKEQEKTYKEGEYLYVE